MIEIKRGGIATEALVMLIVVVITSGVILLLVSTGVISVKASGQEDVLNTGFLPGSRSGTVAIKGFSFCQSVEGYECLGPTNTFVVGDLIHFNFIVETTPYQGEVILTENYRLKGPEGNVLLEVEEKENLFVEEKSDKSLQQVHFKDFIASESGDVPGVYTLELVVTNSLLDKRVTLVEEFILE